MSKQFHAFRAPPALRPSPAASQHARKAWLRLSRDLSLRLRGGGSARRRLVLLLLALLLLLLPLRLALLARAGRHAHGRLALHDTACSCPLSATAALFEAHVLAHAHLVAKVSFLRNERRAIVFRPQTLFRGPLRAAQFDLVVDDDAAAACFAGASHRSAERDTWLLVGAGIAPHVPDATGRPSNRSRVLPGWLAGPGCPRAPHAVVPDHPDGALVWLSPWSLLSAEVVEAIREDAAEGDLWWRRKHAWLEFAPAMHRAGNITVLKHALSVHGALERLPRSEAVTERRLLQEEWWLKNGVSLIAACKDRSITLSRAIRSWTALRGVDEILLIDWSSDPPVEQALSDDLLGDERITLVRVSGQSDWVLSRAYNLAARLASYTRLMKVDCDTFMEAGFFDSHPLPEGTFYAGDWRQLSSGVTNELHVNGLMYVKRDDFLSVGGYDERITTYGWDDSDIAERLSRVGKAKRFDYNQVHHIAHPASLRVVNQHHQSLLPPDNPHAAAVEIQRNRLLLTRFHIPEWLPTALHTQWNVAQKMHGKKKHKDRSSKGPGRVFSITAANEVTSVVSLVSDADALDVSKRAIRLILHRYGVQLLPKSLTLEFYKELITKVAFPENYAEVVLSLRGGCASRLLAYASSNQATTGARLKDTSSEIADSTYVWPPLPYRGWRLQGLWRYPDSECSCKFPNVFDAKEEEVISTWPDTANPLRPYVPVTERQPSVDVTAILKSFDSRAAEKAISSDLLKWTKNSSGHGRHSKPRILVEDFACDLDPHVMNDHRRDLIRVQLRKLSPTKEIQETVATSLMKHTPIVLDSLLLGRDMWPALVGKDFATTVTDKFTSPEFGVMTASWGASSVSMGQPAHRLDRRAASLIVAVNVAEKGVHSPDQLTETQSQELTNIVTTISRRVQRLFIGCLSPASSYLEAYPELAFILAGFLSCGTCV